MSRKRIPLIALSLLASAMAAGPAPALPDPTPHKLSISKTGSGTGTVKSAVGGIDCGGKCSNDYSPRVPVRLEARNGTGFFVGWSGDCQGTSPVCNLVMDASKNVTARFELPKLVLKKVDKAKEFQIVSSKPGIDCGGACTATFEAGSSITLEAKGGPAGYVPAWIRDPPTGGTPSTRETISMKSPVVELKIVAAETILGRRSATTTVPLAFSVTETRQRCELPLGNTIAGQCRLALERGKSYTFVCEGGPCTWDVRPLNVRCIQTAECRLTIPNYQNELIVSKP